MENSESPWSSWCRLCAKENGENYVSIHFSDNQESLATSGDVELTLKEALEKYFWVQTSCEDSLPKHLCLDCYSLISSIMLFNERVEKVQQMYNFLLENPMYDAHDLKSVRIQFDVSDSNIQQWCHSQTSIESISENANIKVCQSPIERCESISESNQATTKDRGTEIFKQENSENESSPSEYEENNDADNVSIDMEEVLYDEEFIDNESQEEDDDPFDAVSDDSSWDEREEKVYRKSLANKRTSARNKKNADDKTVATSNHKKRRKNLGNTICKKKKNTNDDFVLDVACKECGLRLYLYSTYCEHMEKVHANASADKCCPICNRSLQTWYHLGRHMRVHMPLEYRKPIKCPECENRYTSTAQLDVHINHKHRNEKPFICEVCGFCGGTKNSLTQHMYMHTDKAPFECEVCKKKFKKRSRLNIHMDIHGPNKFICTVCGLQLNSRATLKNHLVVHSDEKRHKCDHCGKAFKRSKALKCHLILHTGLRPYSCNFCELTYSNRTNCRGHMRKMHPEEMALLEASGNKPYTKNVPKLETLKAVTKAADNLKSISKSSGYFACEFCDSNFSVRQSCQAHMKRKHPTEFASMNAKGNKTNTKNAPKSKTIKIVDWFDFGKSETCDFCDRTYATRKYCRAHIRGMHAEELVSGSKTHKKNMAKLETDVSTIPTDSLSTDTKFSDSFTIALQSIEKPKSPLDLTPCASTTSSTNIQDYFLLID